MFLFNIGSQIILDKENIPVQKPITKDKDLKMNNKEKNQHNLIEKGNILNSSINSSSNSFLEEILTNQIIAEGISEYLQSDMEIKENLEKSNASKYINLMKEKKNNSEQMIIKIKNEKKTDIIQESFFLKETKVQKQNNFRKHSFKSIQNKQSLLIDSFVIQMDQDQNLDESHFIEAQFEELNFNNTSKQPFIGQNKMLNDEILVRVQRLQKIYDQLVQKLKKVKEDGILSIKVQKKTKKLKTDKKTIYLKEYKIQNLKKHKKQSKSLSKSKNILYNKSSRAKSSSNFKSAQHAYFKNSRRQKVQSDNKQSKTIESKIKSCKTSSEYFRNKYKDQKTQNIFKKGSRYLKL